MKTRFSKFMSLLVSLVMLISMITVVNVHAADFGGLTAKSSGTSTVTVETDNTYSGDGAVKINDLILVQSHILGTKMLSGAKLYAGDTSYDGLLYHQAEHP